MDFLLNVRLTKAKDLLTNSDKSVGEISDECGFSSANYFGLIFKKKEGLSPLQYRKNQQSKVWAIIFPQDIDFYKQNSYNTSNR